MKVSKHKLNCIYFNTTKRFLSTQVWPAMAVIGGVDGGLRVGGQCLVAGTKEAMVLGMLKPGSTSLKVAIGCSYILPCTKENVNMNML